MRLQAPPRPYDVVIGLDVSLTDTGYVMLEYNEETSKWDTRHAASLKTDPKSPDTVRQCSVVTAVLSTTQKLLGGAERVGVIIEDSGTSRFAGKLVQRLEMVGAIRYSFLTVFGFDVFGASPSAVKKFMGHGKNTKEEMISLARQNFGFISDNHNVVDAFCLCRYLIANRANTSLTIKKASSILSLSYLQIPASGDGKKVAKLPLTKNLRPLTLKPATTASRPNSSPTGA
jgi:hypothetical protein